jgi:hypothetical protein
MYSDYYKTGCTVDNLIIEQFAIQYGISISIGTDKRTVLYGPSKKKPDIQLMSNNGKYIILPSTDSRKRKATVVPNTPSNTSKKPRKNLSSSSNRVSQVSGGILMLSNGTKSKISIAQTLIKTVLARVSTSSLKKNALRASNVLKTVQDLLKTRVHEASLPLPGTQLRLGTVKWNSDKEKRYITATIHIKSMYESSMTIHIQPEIRKDVVKELALFRFSIPFVDVAHGNVRPKRNRDMLSPRYKLDKVVYHWEFRLKPSESCSKYIQEVIRETGMQNPVELVRLDFERRFLPKNIRNKLASGTLSASEHMQLYEQILYTNNGMNIDIANNGSTTLIKLPWKDTYTSIKTQEAQTYLRNIFTLRPHPNAWNQNFKSKIDAIFDEKRKGGDNMFFINAHGVTLSQTFTIPPNVYLLTMTPPASLGYGPIGVFGRNKMNTVNRIKDFVYGNKNFLNQRHYVAIFKPGDIIHDNALSWIDRSRSRQQQRGVFRLPFNSTRFDTPADLYWKLNQNKFVNDLGIIKVNSRQELATKANTLSNIIESIRNKSSKTKPILIIANPCRDTKGVTKEVSNACVKGDLLCRKQTFGCIVPAQPVDRKVMGCVSTSIHSCFYGREGTTGQLKKAVKKKKIKVKR